MPVTATPTIVWFHRDLRVDDHPALAAAAARGPVVPAFVWAPDEEGRWPPGGASRWWLHHSLDGLSRELRTLGASLVIRRGPSADAIAQLATETGAAAVYWNRRYEPAAARRDERATAALRRAGLVVETFRGDLLHEPDALATQQGKPYQVFTPYWKACLALGEEHDEQPSPRSLRPAATAAASLPLDELKLLPTLGWDAQFYETWHVGARAAADRLNEFVARGLRHYERDRSRLDLVGSSLLSPHLHFGEVSPRQVWVAVRAAAAADASLRQGAGKFLAELGWREFSYHLLHHFPHTADEPLRENFRRFHWSWSRTHLRAWQRGQTGYPIVDAAMRQLWATGFMPNRARMIVASFLTKHLRIRWQDGARWFWDTLVDADLANNTMGWQWTAGSGADAAPYFRVFNPMSQAEKFDPQGNYVRRWVPELSRLPAPWIFQPWTAPDDALAEAGVKLGATYPGPIVDHAAAREAALAAWRQSRGE